MCPNPRCHTVLVKTVCFFITEIYITVLLIKNNYFSNNLLIIEILYTNAYIEAFIKRTFFTKSVYIFLVMCYIMGVENVSQFKNGGEPIWKQSIKLL